MQPIGLLDSPHVRRVAISLRLLGVPFGRRPLSVFRAAEALSHLERRAPWVACLTARRVKAGGQTEPGCEPEPLAADAAAPDRGVVAAACA